MALVIHGMLRMFISRCEHPNNAMHPSYSHFVVKDTHYIRPLPLTRLINIYIFRWTIVDRVGL